MLLSFLRKITKKIFIVVNIVTGMIFLGGAYANLFDPGKYWFFNLFTLALPYLILVLVLFVFFWLLVKPFWCLLPVFFIVIGWNAVENIIPIRFKTSFVKEKVPGAIRVLSWNVELFNIQNTKTNPSGLTEMLDLINEYDPDIACFQEVVAGDVPGSSNHYDKILKKLNFRDDFFAYRLKNDFDRYHHFGIAVFSKYPVIKKQFLINNPDDYNSSFQYVDLLIGTDTVRVFNIHLQSLKFSKENRNYLDSININNANTSESLSVIEKVKKGIMRRAIQARFVKDAMNHTSYPRLLCGDFNDVPVSYSYSIIGEGMQNAFVKKGYGLSPTFDGIAPTLRIDNIFADSSFSVIQFTRIRSPLSDHFPIVADLKLRTPE